MDHLFLDQDGVLTLGEVKRQTDTRLRREVVGQMLDYAANAVMNWSADKLREQFTNACESKNTDPGAALADLIGPEGDADKLWDKVKTNLKAGRIRLLFVADQIPSEVRGIVEFLNRQMDPAEVLAIELRQYEGEGLRTIVPAVFGQTEEAQQRKSGASPKRQRDEATIFEQLEQRFSPEAVSAGRDIAQWMKSHGVDVWFGQGSRDGSMNARFIRGGASCDFLSLWTYGKVMLSFANLQYLGTVGESLRDGWLERLRMISGLNLPPDAGSRYPTVPLATLVGGTRLKEFIDTLTWLAAEASKL